MFPITRRKTAAMVVTFLALPALLVGPAEAKKSKKAADVTWYLRNETSECTNDGAFQLKLEAGSDQTNCGFRVGGPLNEVLIAAGDSPLSYTYFAVEGLPVVLDASKAIRGSIFVLSNPVSAGPSTTVVTVSGSVNGKGQELGTYQEDYTVAGGSHEVKFEIDLAKKLMGKKLTDLSITLYQRGWAPEHNYYEVSTSHIIVPTLK